MNTKNLQLIADYLRTVKQEEFDMGWVESCVIGHAYFQFSKEGMLASEHQKVNWFDDFIDRNNSNFDARKYISSVIWKYKDNTPQGAANRIEHVIQWLESPSRDEEYFLKILKETFPGYYNL